MRVPFDKLAEFKFLTFLLKVFFILFKFDSFFQAHLWPLVLNRHSRLSNGTAPCRCVIQRGVDGRLDEKKERPMFRRRLLGAGEWCIRIIYSCLGDDAWCLSISWYESILVYVGCRKIGRIVQMWSKEGKTETKIMFANIMHTCTVQHPCVSIKRLELWILPDSKWRRCFRRSDRLCRCRVIPRPKILIHWRILTERRRPSNKRGTSASRFDVAKTELSWV